MVLTRLPTKGRCSGLAGTAGNPSEATDKDNGIVCRHLGTDATGCGLPVFSSMCLFGVSLEHATAQGCRTCVGSQVPLSWLELVKNKQGNPCFNGSSWLLVLTAKPVKKGEGEVQGQDSVCDSLSFHPGRQNICFLETSFNRKSMAWP